MEESYVEVYATRDAGEAAVICDEVLAPNGVDAVVRTKTGEERHSGGWLIGADGGRSTVRKRAGISFDGFTWEERFLVLTTPFDFEAERGYCPRSYFADPEEWCNCFKVSANGPPGLWRTVYPTDPKIPEAELMSEAAVQARLPQSRALVREKHILSSPRTTGIAMMSDLDRRSATV